MGRNLAIKLAAIRLGDEDFIVTSTNVCRLDPSWLEELVRPIEEGKAKVSKGAYHTVAYNDHEETMALLTCYGPGEQRDARPAALNMAFLYSVIRDLGGFDEALGTSEDTEFAERLAAKGHIVAWAPKAEARWRPHTLTYRDAFRTCRRFAETDVRGGVNLGTHEATLLFYVLDAVLWATMPVLGLAAMAAYLLFRARKVVRRFLAPGPYALGAIFVVDAARIVGYLEGRSGR